MAEPQSEKRFHNLTLQQLQALDQILTEVIPIQGRGNFPTLQVRAKDLIRVVKDRLVERKILVKDIRLNGATASHVLVKDNGLGVRDLDIIFRVELPRQEDFQVIKEVVLGSLRDLLPSGVKRSKITCLTMKEAYVQKMVKVFTEQDRWSLIALSNNRARTVGLRFVSTLRRQFEFSVDSFQIILDRVLQSYWETDRRQRCNLSLDAQNLGKREESEEQAESKMASCGEIPHGHEDVTEKEPPHAEKVELASDDVNSNQEEEDVVCEPFCKDDPVVSPPLPSNAEKVQEETSQPIMAQDCLQVTTQLESSLEFSSPPPAKKTCSTSQDVVPDYCPSPKLQRKMSRKMICTPERWSLLTDVSDMTTQMFTPIQIPPQPKPPVHKEAASQESFADPETNQAVEPTVKHKEPPDGNLVNVGCTQQEQEEAPPLSSWGSSMAVEAECMYGDFGQAIEHLRHRLISTHNPEEIRGGGLLKYSDLLVRNFRPASENEIKSLERYMCSRFFIDFSDVGEQQRKIEAYLQYHFTGSEESSRYDYLMTLRRVIDESTVCLMGHERRQTLNMITVLALRVLGEQNAIPNAANVTCFYQPAPYLSEPIYGSYFVTPPQPPLIYHPYPVHVHMQSGVV
ncbi:terminal nucleotidyltransferase 5C-like [Entelurus aequoreus]|uniref:terminal nucleotidyltransferase 5C-like n=1 Tax=Entelurus aequoreus TaxID=161455 RepID=UPI002B1E646A|nr:terminal nucleotidyltransferase 5C-like [Entelurus aequoreus]XP_061903981.1 terminal nucleotidyltransferase 5C-like [Entelurus aequoreus]